MFQLSLRTLLAAMALAALAIVSLRFATPGWRIAIVSLAMIAICAALIVAFLDRGVRQAFAIGFATTALLYAAVVNFPPPGSQSRIELNPDVGRLPTTWLLRPIYHSVAYVGPIDLRTRKPVEKNVAQNAANANISMGELPSRQTFMVIGHAWWTILLGLWGGWFAQWVYVRRQRAGC